MRSRIAATHGRAPARSPIASTRTAPNGSVPGGSANNGR